MKYLVVKNYEKFQHYRDRLPPWIKLYNTLLDDYAFIELPETSRIHLVLIWLVASRHENRIPYDLKYLARAIHAKSRINIPRLVEAGFLTITEQSASADASTTLAESGQSSSEETGKDASKALAESGEEAGGDASTHARPRARERESTGAGEDRETTTHHGDGANAEAEQALRDAMGDEMAAVDRFLATRPYRSRGNWYPELLRVIGPTMSAKPADLAGACTDALIVDPPVTTPHALRAFVQKQMQVRTAAVIAKVPSKSTGKAAASDPVAEAAWMATLALLPKWIRREVTTETFAGMTPPMRAAVSAVGGFQQIAATPDDRRVWLKKDFLAAYHRAAQLQQSQTPEAQSA